MIQLLKGLLSAILLVFLVGNAASFPIRETEPVSLGTINGTSVIAITHGNSEQLKELIPSKNTESDSFDMFGGMALGSLKNQKDR